jgi:UDP-N-acetylglucosamine acyltransferase
MSASISALRVIEDPSNDIHPTVVMEGEVRLGRGNRIGAYSVLIGPLDIGDDNIIGPHVTIGGPGQDTRARHYDCSAARVRIGNGNIIREHSSISKPIHRALTSVGDRCFLMQGVHVPHDLEIQDDVTIAGVTGICGLVRLLRGAHIAPACAIHQHSVVGQFSMASMNATVQKNIPPFSRYIPRVPLSVNDYAIEKFGYRKYADEISDYVLRRVPPHSAPIVDIVREFDALSLASGRRSY